MGGLVLLLMLLLVLVLVLVLLFVVLVIPVPVFDEPRISSMSFLSSGFGFGLRFVRAGRLKSRFRSGSGFRSRNAGFRPSGNITQIDGGGEMSSSDSPSASSSLSMPNPIEGCVGVVEVSELGFESDLGEFGEDVDDDVDGMLILPVSFWWFRCSVISKLDLCYCCNSKMTGCCSLFISGFGSNSTQCLYVVFIVHCFTSRPPALFY